MKIEYAVPIPEKARVLHVGLRYEAATDGEDKIHEVPVRRSHYERLTAAAKLAYVQECERWHYQRDAAVRAKWDADDKATAEAAAEAARRAELARFVVVPQAYVTDEHHVVLGVRVLIRHQGHECVAVIPAEAENAEANARVVWQQSKEIADAEAWALAAFQVSA